jgi:hypothetical protein
MQSGALISRGVLGLASCASISSLALGQQEPEVSFKDPEDGAFDISRFLATRTGFMPVPILITEPAIGYGGGMGLMFIHDKPRDADGQPAKGPPSVSLVVGGYTESDTWFGGLGHFGSWDDDHWRYTGLLGRGHANLEFNGIGGNDAGIGGQNELDYTLDGVFLRQQLLREIADSPLYLGLRYEFAKTDTEFDTGVPVVDNYDFDRQDGGLAAVVQYDTRDSFFTPNNGVNAVLSAYHYDQSFGGDTAYNRLEIDSPMWWQLDPQYVLGVRPVAAFTDGDAPFYALPYVELRGVPVLRYQGHDAASVEAELRWNFVRRWALLGFGGVGQAVDDLGDFGGGSYTVTAGGVGMRYLIASKYGMHVGLDVARGPEDWAVYIQVGTAWH